MENASGSAMVVGWKELIDFPDWAIHKVKAKIDTGARTSALDVVNYELRSSPAGTVAELRLALDRRHPERVKIIEASVLGMVVVSNSSGMREHRPLIETAIRLGNITKRIQLTVTNRHSMRFPVILGRTTLADHFLVDVSRKYVLRKKKSSGR
jgi:hypothetical protein